MAHTTDQGEVYARLFAAAVARVIEDARWEAGLGRNQREREEERGEGGGEEEGIQDPDEYGVHVGR